MKYSTLIIISIVVIAIIAILYYFLYMKDSNDFVTRSQLHESGQEGCGTIHLTGHSSKKLSLTETKGYITNKYDNKQYSFGPFTQNADGVFTASANVDREASDSLCAEIIFVTERGEQTTDTVCMKATKSCPVLVISDLKLQES